MEKTGSPNKRETIKGVTMCNRDVRVLILAAVTVAAILIAGCAAKDIQGKAYTTLSMSSATYDFALSMAGGIYGTGALTDDQKNEIIRLGRIYKNAHNATVRALIRYNRTGAMSDQRDYLSELSNASLFLADMLSYINPLIEKE